MKYASYNFGDFGFVSNEPNHLNVGFSCSTVPSSQSFDERFTSSIFTVSFPFTSKLSFIVVVYFSFCTQRIYPFFAGIFESPWVGFEHFKNVNLEYHEEVYGKKTKYQIPDIEVFGKYGMHKVEALKETLNDVLKLLEEYQIFIKTANNKGNNTIVD